MTASTNATLRVVAFIVFVDMAGMGITIPVMPQLIRDITHVEIGRAAIYSGLMLVAFAVMQFLFSPIIGGLSDRFGRRPVLIVTLASFAIDYALMAFAPNLALLAIGRMISGVMGATWAAANSCVSDLVPEAERGSAFGLVGGAGAAGLVLGPAIGGIVGEHGARLPFLAASVLAAAGVLLAFAKLSESLPKQDRRRFEIRRASPIWSFVQTTKTPFVFGGLAVLFLVQLTVQAQSSIWAFYGKASFGWTPMEAGLTTSLYGILMVVVRAVITRIIIRRCGAAKTARVSVLFLLPSYAMLAFAPGTVTVVFAIVIGSLAGMTFPSVQALMSTKVTRDAQGELQGAIGSSNALAAIIGPLLMTRIFDAFVDSDGVFLPGAPFLLSAAIAIVAVLLLWTITANHRSTGAP